MPVKVDRIMTVEMLEVLDERERKCSIDCFLSLALQEL